MIWILLFFFVTMTVSSFYSYRYAHVLFTCVPTLNRHHWSSWHCWRFYWIWSSNMPPQDLGEIWMPSLDKMSNRSFLRVVSDITVGVNIGYGGRPYLLTNDICHVLSHSYDICHLISHFVPIYLRIPLREINITYPHPHVGCVCFENFSEKLPTRGVM